MLIAMAGLPATGKTTIAHQLAPALPSSGIILNKDRIRAALFPVAEIEYSETQDDFCVGIMYQVAEYIHRKDRNRYVILDGRTFSKRYQVVALLDIAAKFGVPLRIIECTCSDQVAKQRLENKAAQEHHAANRNFELYLSLKEQAQPIEGPKIVLKTDQNCLEDNVQMALSYVLQ